MKIHSSSPEHVGPLPKIAHGQKSRLGEKEARRIDAERHERDVYAHIDRRDQNDCRVCGRRLTREGLLTAGARHRHHIVFRSQGGQTTSANMVCICATCHELIHTHGLLSIEGDANGPLTFGRRHPETGEWTYTTEVTTAYSVTRGK